MVNTLSKNSKSVNLNQTSLQKKEGNKMRESIIERILALTDEQVQELLTLIQQLEEEDSTSQAPHRTSA